MAGVRGLMQSTALFITISALVLLIPFCIVIFAVKLTTIKIPKKPKGYNASYILLAVAAVSLAGATYHMWGQIALGTIRFQARSMKTPWLFLYEIQPLYFLGMSVFYIVFILVSIGALVIMHKKIEAHFRKKL